MTATFPAFTPSSRAFDSGDFPVKAFQSQDGAEFRILYGDKRVGMTLKLTYSNIPDNDASEFVDHYHDMQGTYQQFSIGEGTKKGWTGGAEYIDAVSWGSLWRYENAPQLESIYPGVSSVTVTLKAATI